ncbi:hypothetical protein CBS101457_004871 [Exobasidium rhododendri]|nr:hypothetical protein CBS101457_004871 [Exobasidium rhododendri]
MSAPSTVDDDKLEQDKRLFTQTVDVIEEPEADERPIQGVAVPKTGTPTSPLNGYMLFCTLVVGFGGLNWGYENALVGPISAMRAFVAHMQGVNPDTGLYVLTARNQSILFSVPLTGTVIGALASSPMQARFGRKWSLICSYCFSIGAVFVQLFAPTFPVFIVGRWWNAVSYGSALAIAPNYLADLVPASMRGRFVSAANIATIAASVLATSICVVTQKTHALDRLSYMIPLAVQACLPFCLLIPTLFCCESPSWLLTKGRVSEARATLRSIRGFSDEDVEKELAILQAIEEESRLREMPKFWEIYRAENIRRTLVGGSIFSLNQCSGIILSTTYATVFLTQLGVGDPFVLSLIGNLCLFAGTIGAPFVLDNFGRRPTALIGFTLLFVIDCISGGLAFIADRNISAGKAIAGLSFLFNICWTLSFYSISLLMPAEVPTERLRNATMTHAIGFGQLTAILTTLLLPLITAQDAGNLGAKAYLIFAGLMLMILISAALLLPETRGRTSLEIDELYARKVSAWRWKGFETRSEIDRRKQA